MKFDAESQFAMPVNHVHLFFDLAHAFYLQPLTTPFAFLFSKLLLFESRFAATSITITHHTIF